MHKVLHAELDPVPAAAATDPGLLPIFDVSARFEVTNNTESRFASWASPAQVTAFNELLREILAPVPADLVCCHPRFAAEHAFNLATDWANYAAIRTHPSPAKA
ncbi:hypothetical protein IU470_18680 [Nocardia abscessus]|uniref:Antibiotic biosynthesis monooxygenase n=1 Tax=Nocardia abscessus TaxID=120957 RepID=A0ABS0C9S1_9NOCA|nr:hypothetical protein [Nocardia abscessus]